MVISAGGQISFNAPFSAVPTQLRGGQAREGGPKPGPQQSSGECGGGKQAASTLGPPGAASRTARAAAREWSSYRLALARVTSF